MKPKKDGYGEEKKNAASPLRESRRRKPGRSAGSRAVLPEAGLRADNRC